MFVRFQRHQARKVRGYKDELLLDQILKNPDPLLRDGPAIRLEARCRTSLRSHQERFNHGWTIP